MEFSAGTTVRYNSTPPTSGPHSGFTIATGIYDSPVRDAQAVHAMEHGHVIIHYAPDVSTQDIAVLHRIAKHYPVDVILAPHPGLPDPLQVARYRERHSVSGAKSDTADAHTLADMVRTDRHHLRPIAGDSVEAEAVKVITRTQDADLGTYQASAAAAPRPAGVLPGRVERLRRPDRPRCAAIAGRRT
jgi:hypothetical protein